MMYTVAATGGLETPSFLCFTKRDDADNKFNEWAGSLLSVPGDRVDLIFFDGEFTVTLNTREYLY